MAEAWAKRGIFPLQGSVVGSLIFSKMNQVWHIFCINLPHRRDRRIQIEAQGKLYGLDIEFYPAIRHIHGHTGCMLSHLAVIQLAKQRKYENILILEDDAGFVRAPLL